MHIQYTQRRWGQRSPTPHSTAMIVATVQWRRDCSQKLNAHTPTYAIYVLYASQEETLGQTNTNIFLRATTLSSVHAFFCTVQEQRQKSKHYVAHSHYKIDSLQYSVRCKSRDKRTNTM